MTAFSTLHERNAAAAMAVARGLTRSSADAEDLVAEGFTKVMEAVRRGNGPDDAFRPYLLTVIRRLAYDTSARRQREEVSATAGEEATIDLDDPAIVGFERELVRDAFATLPERWQTVLWQTEVEDRRPQDIAPSLGLSANAAAALTYRAREGLRQAYLAAHRRQDTDPGCGRVLDRLPAYVRGSLASRGERAVATHLDTCDRCLAAYLELIEINSDLRAAFVGFGVLAAAAVAAATQAAHRGTGAKAGRLVRRGLGKAHVGGASATAALVVAVAVVAVAVGLASSPGSKPQPEAGATTTTPGGASRPKTTRGTEPRATPGSTSGPFVAPVGPVPPAVPTTLLPGVPATSVPPGLHVPPTTVPTPPSTSRPHPTVPSTVVPRNPPMSLPPVVPAPITADATPMGSLVAGKPGVVALTVRGLPAGFHAGSVTVTAGGGDLEAVADAGHTDCVPSGASLVCSLAAPTSPGLVSRFVRVRPAPGATSVALALHFDGGAVLAAERNTTLSVAVEAGPFRSQFAAEGRLAIATTGATVLTCSTAADLPAAEVTACAEARGRTGDRQRNNDWPLTHVDMDTDPTSFDSSSAPLAVPSGARVRFAGLTFGGSLAAGEGGSAAPDPAAAGSAVLNGPDGRRTVVTAAAADVDHLVTVASIDQYQAFVDVTSLVQAGGVYSVADVQVGTGTSGFGGWTLTVVYEDASRPVRVASVLTGLADAPGAGASASFGLGGLGADSSASADVAITSWEGDPGLGPESATIWGTTLSDGTNPADDFANSSNFVAAGANMFGVDIDRFSVSPVAAAGPTSIALTGGDDVWALGTIVAVVPRSPLG